MRLTNFRDLFNCSEINKLQGIRTAGRVRSVTARLSQATVDRSGIVVGWFGSGVAVAYPD